MTLRLPEDAGERTLLVLLLLATFLLVLEPGRVPLFEPDEGRYGEIVNSTTKREATALTAAEFLHHFAGDVPWAHLDVAGTAYDVRRPYFADRGATGYGVRLLVDLAANGTGA